MTTLIYNGVVIRDCDTAEVSGDVIYDASGTDKLYTKYTIKVTSTVVSLSASRGSVRAAEDIDTRPFGFDTDNGQTIVERQQDIEAKLLQPRGDFWFIIDNCPTDERGATFGSRDQPMIIAAGKAFDERISQSVVGGLGGTVEESVNRTELFMEANPLLRIGRDATTRLYGNSSIQISKKLVLDCDNGPKPKKVVVEQIMGGRALSVSFVIEVCRNICPEDFEDLEPAILNSGIPNTSVPGTGPGTGVFGRQQMVLSNRWSIEESKDENWKTSRKFEGTLRVANREFFPHAFRFLCVPPLLEGYQRVSQDFVSDPTDTVLKWRIVDKQQHAAPPAPAIKWEGHHAETASGPNGIRKSGELRVKLQGPPGVDKQQLISTAAKIAVNRIRGLRPMFPAGSQEPDRTFNFILNSAAIIDILQEPTIELKLNVSYTDASFQSLALRLKEFGRNLDLSGEDPTEAGVNPDVYTIAGYNPKQWPVPLPYDSKLPAGVFRNYLSGPCSSYHGVPKGVRPGQDPQIGIPQAPPLCPSGAPDRSQGSENMFQEQDPLPDESSGKNSSNPTDPQSGGNLRDVIGRPYDYYELEQTYVIDNGLSQIPFSGAGPGQPTALVAGFSAPTAKRVLVITATRDGHAPELPPVEPVQTDSNGITEHFSSLKMTTLAPEVMPDGRGRRIKLKAVYEFLLDRPPSPTERLRGLRSPFDTTEASENRITFSSLSSSSPVGRLVD